jgi:hypothetical protein
VRLAKATSKVKQESKGSKQAFTRQKQKRIKAECARW